MSTTIYKEHTLPDLGHDRYDIPLLESMKKIIDALETTYLIPLVKNGVGVENQWTITEGDNRTGGGYSQAQWDVAYNNKKGIEKALVYAHNNGYQKAVLKRGHYNVCYENIPGYDVTSVLHAEFEMVMQTGLEFDFNRSEISVLFDSDETATSGTTIRNPYDNGSYLPNEIPGNVFGFARAKNSKITNGTLIGDRYERSFVDPDENLRELTNGIFNSKGSAFCEVSNMTIKGFMGDHLTCMTDHNPDDGSFLPYDEARTFYKGMVSRVDGTIDTGVVGAYTTNLVSLSNIICGEMILRTNVGYQRIPDFEHQTLLIAWYDDTDTFIKAEYFKYLELIKIPVSADKVRFCCMKEKRTSASFQITFQVTPPTPHHYIIRNNTLTEGQRGAISNLVNNSLVEFNRIYNNGLGWKQNLPQFNDSTRYAINCEDVVSNHVDIINNQIDATSHGMLLCGLHIEIHGNKVMNCENAIIFYSIENALVTQNKFINCNSVLGFDENDLKRDVQLLGNMTDNCRLLNTSALVCANTCVTVDNLHDRSELPTISVNHDYVKNMIFKGIMFNELPNLEDIYAYGILSGRFLDCTFNLNQTQFQTAAVHVIAAKGSRLEINCADINKRVTPNGSVWGLEQHGGTQHRFLQPGENKTINWHSEGSTLNIDRFHFEMYGAPTSTTNTLNFYDQKFTMRGGFNEFFNMHNDSSSGTNDLVINLYNCEITIPDTVGGVLFYIYYLGADQNVTINLNDTIIDTTATSEIVYLGDRSGGHTNQVQVNKSNVTIKGSLDESDAGFNVVVV